MNKLNITTKNLTVKIIDNNDCWDDLIELHIDDLKADANYLKYEFDHNDVITENFMIHFFMMIRGGQNNLLITNRPRLLTNRRREIFENSHISSDALKSLRNKDDTPVQLVYGIFSNEKLIGFVNYYYHNYNYYISIYICQKESRKGYATEVINDFVDKMFDLININQVYYQCHNENESSINLALKTGFKQISDTDTYPSTGQRCLLFSKSK